MAGTTTKKRSLCAAGRNFLIRPVLMRFVHGVRRLTGLPSLLMICLCAVFLSACLPEPTPTPTPTPAPTITQTPTPTATIVWFPPTPTFTPGPTRQIEPTQDMRPALGSKLLEDDFSRLNLWQTSKTEVGSIAYGKNELTLAVSTSKGALLSLRKTPQFEDFYAEIDTLPSLCRSGDAYGLLLRAGSAQDYYRVLVNCNGQLRLDRVKASRSLVLQDWMASGQLQPGGLLPARLGVWAVGDELRVFVNDVYQFTLRDPTFQAGTLGVYARAAGDSPLTVNFSHLTVYTVKGGNVRPPAATLTRTPAPAKK